MPVPVPLSPAYSGLAIALPGVWLAGRAAAHRITRDRGLRAVLPLGLSLAIWIVAVQLASLAAGSFLAGLPAGTLLAAAAGIALEIDRRRRDPRAPEGRAPAAWMGVTAIASAAAIYPAAFHFWFHDELLTTGHLSTVAQIHNGIFPPRHLTFPEVPFRYHYGFDLFAASISAITRAPADVAVDLASIALWALSWCLLWVLGERLIGRRAAWLTPFTVLYAGGLPLRCQHPGPSIVPNLVGECEVGAWSVNGPLISYFFQHPWALGIPLAITAVLVITERGAEGPWIRAGALALLLGALSLSEVALFVATLPVLAAAEVRFEDRAEVDRAPAVLAAITAAIGLSRLMGGFFTSAPGLGAMRFALHAGFEDTLKLTLKWNAMTFGALGIAGVAGFFALRRGRLLFGLLAAGGVIVVNGVRFSGTADIMKFATVASLGLGVLGSAAIARLYRPNSPIRATAAAALLAGATWVGVLFPIFFALGLGDLPGSLRDRPEVLSPDDIQAISFLRARARAGELVYRTERAAGYAQWGGLPVPWTNWTTRAWGFPAAKIAARRRFLEQRPTDLAAYRREGVRWLVLDEDRGDDRRLIEAGRGWIARGEAALAARFGSLWIVEIHR